MLKASAVMVAGLIATVAGLSACKQSAAPTTQETDTADTTAAAVGPDAKPGVSAGSARLVLPIVAGRPGVAYFRVSNNSASAITLAAVHIEGVGKAEMHRTSGGKMTPVTGVPIASGANITFAPGGLHVMAFDIDAALKAGGQTEMTLTFADGDKISIPAKIEAGGQSHDMAGMNH